MTKKKRNVPEIKIASRVDDRLKRLILGVWYTIVPESYKEKIVKNIREIDQVSHPVNYYGSTGVEAFGGSIRFSDAILQLDDTRIMYAIAHEFAHASLLGKRDFAISKRIDRLIINGPDGWEAELEQLIAEAEKKRENDEKKANLLVAQWLESYQRNKNGGT